MSKEFIWTDELVKELIYQRCPIEPKYAGNVQRMVDDFKKEKQTPLFWTEDRVDIWHSEYFPIFVVTLGDYGIYQEKAKDCLPLSCGKVYFAYEAKAKEFVKINKPLNISMKELGSCITNYVQNIFGPGQNPFESPYKRDARIDLEKLEKLIEQKQKS